MEYKKYSHNGQTYYYSYGEWLDQSFIRVSEVERSELNKRYISKPTPKKKVKSKKKRKKQRYIPKDALDHRLPGSITG